MDIVFLVVLQALACGLFCRYVAQEKGRNYRVWFALGYFFSIFALLSLVALPRVKSESPPQEFDGPRDLDAPVYQLFLTRRFGIERNPTLDKFVIGNEVFPTLAEALATADGRYGQHLDELARQQAQLEQERLKAEAATRLKQEFKRAETQRRLEERKRQRAKWLEAIRKAIPWAIGAVATIYVVGELLSAQERSAAQGRCDRGETPWIMKQTTDPGVLRQCISGGMLWTRSDNGQEVRWPEAQSYCSSLGDGGWSLPNVAQLQSLYREELPQQPCAGYGCRVTELLRLGSASQWSSERNGTSEAWTVSLSNGDRSSFLADNAHYTGRALCVRRP
jgi:hypothetical protein